MHFCWDALGAGPLRVLRDRCAGTSGEWLKGGWASARLEEKAVCVLILVLGRFRLGQIGVC